MSVNIPTDLLRAFVTVVDLGGYTKAAAALGRTQPAISLQIRRLETLLRAKLLETDGRTLKLTDAGLALGPYARQILRTNDDVIGHFQREALSGWIRIGLPTDFANDFLLDSLTRFAAENPEVRLDVESRLSRDLRESLAADRLHIAVAIASEASAPYLARSWRCQPIWAAPTSRDFDPADPLPLLRHPDPCEYADRMIAALRLARRDWRSVYVSSDVAGLQSAVAAGLGATALTQATLGPGMRVGLVEEGYPTLEPLSVGLYYKHARIPAAAHHLTQWLIERLDAAADRLEPEGGSHKSRK